MASELPQAERTAMEAACRRADLQTRAVRHGWSAARDYGRARERTLEEALKYIVSIDPTCLQGDLEIEWFNRSSVALAASPGEPEGRRLEKALRFYADSYRYVGGNGGFPSDIDRDAGQCARAALAELKGQCDHDFQMHPQSEDFGVCSLCGESQPDHGPGEPSDDVTVKIPRRDAQWLYAQVGKLTPSEVSRETYEALGIALQVQAGESNG